ncbi:MAG TPA: hypothetical protein VFN10_06095 [Thermoanaerobaculia bacterium]|nr:hypothetical protein [Thermoanaerobaculia bacterium]
MKRIAMSLVILLTAATLFAGGKECNMKTHGKNVSLSGTLSRSGEKTVFRAADGHNYSVCEKTDAAVLKLAEDGDANVRVTGKVVSCNDGEELVIESAKKL